MDPRRVRTYLEAFSTLFIVHQIEPHTLSSGKELYYLCDVGLANFLGASFEKQLTTWVLQEILAARQWRTDLRETISHYRTTRGSHVQFVLESGNEVTAVKIIAKESVSELDVKVLSAFGKKTRGKKVKLLALGPLAMPLADGEVTMVPWEAVG